MPSANEIYSSQYLNASLVKTLGLDGKNVVIHDVEAVEFPKNHKRKLVLSLSDTDKLLVLNKTNSKVLSKAFGDDFSMWEGKVITLKVEQTDFSGDRVDAVRVSIPSSLGAA